MKQSPQSFGDIHLEKNLAIESVSCSTAARRPNVPADIERVRLEERLFLTYKGGERRLGRVEGTEPKLHTFHQREYLNCRIAQAIPDHARPQWRRCR